MKSLFKRRFLIIFGLLAAANVFLLAPAAVAAPADVDPEYWDVVMGRADKIVHELDLKDAAKAERVQLAVARFYADLSSIHDWRDAAVSAVRAEVGDFEKISEPALAALESGADAQVAAVRNAFIGALSAELTAEQVVAVKDGLTYGVVPMTYANYMKMLPDIDEEHKRQIYAWLVEAREYAITAGSSRAKHGWFGKYKGKITNYLSALGLDLKEAEKRLFE